MSEEATGRGDASAHPGAVSVRRRYLARQKAIQALYQAQLNPLPPAELVAQFQANDSFAEVDASFFVEGVLAVVRRAEELDAEFAPSADRAPEEIDPIERAILRFAVWELQDRADIPYRVVIDQAVVLAQRFGTGNSYRFINGVLDKVARKLRKAETGIGG